jgi:hypothetical protein
MKNNMTEEMFLIEELEARLEMTTVTLADGTVVEASEADLAEAGPHSKIKCTVSTSCN